MLLNAHRAQMYSVAPKLHWLRSPVGEKYNGWAETCNPPPYHGSKRNQPSYHINNRTKGIPTTRCPVGIYHDYVREFKDHLFGIHAVSLI